MGADEGKRLCREAEVYYYDLLCPDEGAVPEAVRRHVAGCPACQEQMRRLREALFDDQCNPGPSYSWDEATIEALAQQFQLLDQRVTCSEVKPFLPLLASALPQIRIPTPVTVHVDHCLPCAEDLATLQELDLTTDQLQRLSRFFESRRGNGTMPSRSQSQAPFQVEDTGIVCRDVSKADIFDQVVPEVVPPDKRHRAIASHLQACCACQERLQTLQRRIRAILERADSEVTTVYHAASDTADTPQKDGDPYPYPIAVQVLSGDKEEPSPRASDSEAIPAGRRKARKAEWSLFPAGSLAKAAIVALVLTALLGLRWLKAPTASGTDVGDLLKTVAKVQSIHISTMDSYGKVFQEHWIAYRSNRLVAKTTGTEWALYDLNRGRRWTIDPETGVSQPVSMDDRQFNYARKIMANAVREVMVQAPPDTKLQPLTDDTDSETAENLNVYEVTRAAARTATSPLHNRWRIYLGPATGLPRKIEFYREVALRGQAHWELFTTTVFAYPTQQEMDREIKAMFPAL